MKVVDSMERRFLLLYLEIADIIVESGEKGREGLK